MKIIYLGALLALCSCDVSAPEATGTDTSSNEVTSPSATETPADNADVSTSNVSAALFEFSGNDATADLSQLAEILEQDGIVTVSGDFTDVSPGGRTKGAVYRISSKQESDVSGKTVEVQVEARGGPLAMAYSTAEVGNSGWNAAPGSTDWAVHTFRYDVPVLKQGKGDYIGVIPTDAASEIQVKSVKVFVVN